ncbi:UbiH/UbiF family hydroxylase [Mangrovibrevibacter kandeliae]|uniref:UbiH/UbiF family hydroxylase n=1 Tax=Mangrovibrevibacter kandeliae TaxID=2968473 RepID=UPI0021187D01|nr:UbiH/UbiF family hydroxylase [Aurantimonas sp. CSK15Z-1]MCQ8782624.1 UbiH/UbiF family hydroxylase [Aurantimonas sp. CSK15Z-1]
MQVIRREVAVVGGGLAGYAAAIAMADAGFDTVLVAPKAGAADGRTTALIGGSVTFLDRLGVIEQALVDLEPMKVMRLVDDTGRLLRAPTVEFRASDIDLDAFGYNIENAALARALAAVAEAHAERLTVLDTTASGLEVDEDGATVLLRSGDRLRVSLVAAADGRRSLLRDAAGVGLREWAYPQSAIVLNFGHAVPHAHGSTEFHTRTGPFTQVPLPGARSSLVWVEEPGAAALFVDLKAERLSEIVERRLHSLLGAVSVEAPARIFPLRGATATRLTAPRVALVGEAGHVFPPIGAQGLNLGLRDAEAIVRAAAAERADPGSRVALARYEAARAADVVTRTLGVDLLNRSLLADMLPAQALRAAGLTALAAFSPLRRLAMREGLSPGAGMTGVPRRLRAGLGAA